MTSVRALARTPLPRGLSVALCGLVVAGIVLVARAAAAAAVVGRGRLAELLSYEMAVLYYALAPRAGGRGTLSPAAGPREGANREPGGTAEGVGDEAPEPAATAAADPGALTYHRKSAYGAVVFVLLLATLAEVPAAHFLVRQWSERAAWLLTALGLYGALWIVGDWRACRARPIRLEDGVLRVRFGLRWRVDIPLEAIRATRAPTAAEKATRGSVDLRLALPGASWTLLELDRPVEAAGPYGLRREVRTVGLGLDEPERLAAALAAEGERPTR